MTPAFRLLAALLLALPAPLAAQLPALTVPKGRLRTDITASFLTARERLRDGSTESLAADFIRTGLGSDFLAGLEPADSLLRKITGLDAARIDLGRSNASQLVTTGVGGIGLAYGLTRRLTLFGHVPIYRVKVRSTFGFDGGDGLAGFNPADPTYGDGNGQARTAQFFTQFDAALAQLQQRLAAGEFDGNAAQKALAEQTIAGGTVLRDDLQALLLGAVASPFLPTTASAAGMALLQKVTALQGTFSGSFQISSFVQTPALPTATLSEDDFTGFLTNGAGPVAAALTTPTLNALGDVELGAAYALVDQLSGEGARRGYRLAAQGLVRLRTSRRERAARLFDVGTGERQPDVEGTLVGDALFGSFGARALAGYTLQLAGRAEDRLRGPGQPAAYANRLAAVSRDPGEIITIGLTPFARIAETLAITAGAVWRHKASDRVTLLEGQAEIPGASPDLLAEDTDGSWTTAMVGLAYSFAPSVRNGRPKLPVDAGLTYETVVGSSGPLRVPKATGVRLWLRIYTSPW